MDRGNALVKFLFGSQSAYSGSRVNMTGPAQLKFWPGRPGRRVVLARCWILAVDAPDEYRGTITTRSGNKFPGREEDPIGGLVTDPALEVANPGLGVRFREAF